MEKLIEKYTGIYKDLSNIILAYAHSGNCRNSRRNSRRNNRRKSTRGETWDCMCRCSRTPWFMEHGVYTNHSAILNMGDFFYCICPPCSVCDISRYLAEPLDGVEKAPCFVVKDYPDIRENLRIMTRAAAEKSRAKEKVVRIISDDDVEDLDLWGSVECAYGSGTKDQVDRYNYLLCNPAFGLIVRNTCGACILRTILYAQLEYYNEIKESIVVYQLLNSGHVEHKTMGTQ